MTSDRVELSAEARADLDDVLSYILERNPVAAAKLSESIDEALATLALRSPRLDGPVVTLTSGAQCRRWFVHPVVILYERSLGAVFILSFHHYARAPLGR